MFFLVAHTVLLMLQWWFFLKNWEIWSHEPSHGKSQESVRGVVLGNDSHDKQRHMFDNLPWPPTLVLTWYFSHWGHLGWEPPSSYASLYRDHPVGWRAWGEKTRSQAGMRSISLLVGDVLELCIFILHPTLPRPPLHSSVTAHLLSVLQN